MIRSLVFRLLFLGFWPIVCAAGTEVVDSVAKQVVNEASPTALEPVPLELDDFSVEVSDSDPGIRAVFVPHSMQWVRLGTLVLPRALLEVQLEGIESAQVEYQGIHQTGTGRIPVLVSLFGGRQNEMIGEVLRGGRSTIHSIRFRFHTASGRRRGLEISRVLEPGLRWFQRISAPTHGCSSVAAGSSYGVKKGFRVNFIWTSSSKFWPDVDPGRCGSRSGNPDGLVCTLERVERSFGDQVRAAAAHLESGHRTTVSPRGIRHRGRTVFLQFSKFDGLI